MNDPSQKASESASRIGSRVGELAASAAMLGSGSVFATVGTLGAVTLPMMVADLVTTSPITMAGQTLVTSPASAIIAGIQVLALPVAVAMGKHGVDALTAGKGWKKLLDTRLGQRALEATDAMGGLRGAVMVAASSLAGAAATAGTYAATNSTAASMLAMAAAGTAVVAGSSALSGLRKERAERGAERSLSSLRQARQADPHVEAQPAPSAKSSGSSPKLA